VAQENIVKIDGKNQFKVNVTPIEGSNKLEVSVEDSAGNTGAGAHGSNYIPPGISRKGLKVTGNTNIDIPADAFEGTALLTVQTVDVNGQIDMKPLASPIAFTFSEKPKKPIVVSTFIGMGQKGVGMIHIDDNGTVGAFKKAVDQSPINEATMTADLPYYDSKLGVVKLKTADFSAYQVAKDNVSPVITVSTADFEINSSEVPKISGTLTDDDSNAKITEVYVDGNKVEGFIAQGKAFDINVSLTDGNHDVMIKAVDTAGNASTVTKAYKVDKTAPTVTVDYSAKTSESNIAIQMNLNEMAEMFIDGTSVGIFEGSREIDVPLKDGSNKIALKAIDGFGNITTKEIEILKEAPSLSLTVDGIGATTGSTVTVTGTVSNRCNLTVLVNGQAVRTVNDQGAGRYTVSGVGIALNGNTILVKASDLHGNSVEGSIGVQRNSDNPVVVPPNPDGGGIVVPPNPGGGGAVFIPPFIPGMMLPVVEVPKEAKPLNVEAAKTEAKPVVTAGGELDFLDKAVKLVIEKGTFEEESEITVTEIKEIEGAKIRAFKYVDGTEVKLEKKESNTHLKVAGKVYEFDADKETFAKPIEVEFSYDGDSYTEGYKLAVYYYNKEKEQWEHVGGTVDPIAYKIKVKLNHFSTYAVMEYTKTFEDIQAHWAKSDIEEMASQYIAKGTGDKFLPNNNITRAEFATLIVRAFGISADDSADRFKDVSESDWYYETVNAAASAGIVQGFEGTFSPKKNISREEMTIMLMNAYNYEFNKDYKSIYNGKAIAFNDAETISSWSRSAVLGALDLKLVNGSGDNMFNPKNNATRAEAIVVLKRLMGTK